MTQATAYGAALVGLKAHRVTVTARPAATLSIVGLPSEAATKEARVRVGLAIAHCFGVEPTAQVTIEGLPYNSDHAGLDLAIAVAILRLDRKGPKGEIMDVRATKDEAVFIGELSFDGRVRPVRGMLAKTRAGLYAPKIITENLVVCSYDNASEASIGNTEVFSIEKLSDSPVLWKPSVLVPVELPPETRDLEPKLCDAMGMALGKPRVLLVGRPGSGKTLLARALRAALPPPSEKEALKIAEIHSAAGILDAGHITVRVARPFRAPHHTVSEAGLVGGGLTPRPGEASLAHGGVLFLDELPEFRMGALGALAGVLHEGRTPHFPATPALVVASANPCPCGYHGTPRCHCGESTMAGWKKRLEKVSAMFGFVEVRL